MNTDYPDIEDLVYREILGTLSEEDRIVLMNAVTQNSKVHAMREQLKKKLDTPALRKYMTENSNIEQSLLILKTLNKKEKRQKISKAAVLIVGLFVIVIAVRLVIPLITKSNENTIFSSYNLTPSSITLQLPNGKIVVLDSSTQIVHSGNTFVTTQNGTLEYYSQNSDVAEYVTLIVPAGKDYKIKLNDGSIVQLNSETQMRFPLQFSNSKRSIAINGEAYIKVAANSAKPFEVTLPHGTVDVLGTEFNINTYDSGVHRISLVKGSVQVKNDKNSVILKPGQEAITGLRRIQIKTFDESDILSWTEGKYYFTDTYLENVCLILTRWYGIQVTLDNKAAARQRFSGMISRDKPIGLALKGLQETNVISYYIDDAGIVHIR